MQLLLFVGRKNNEDPIYIRCSAKTHLDLTLIYYELSVNIVNSPTMKTNHYYYLCYFYRMILKILTELIIVYQ